MIFVGVKE